MTDTPAAVEQELAALRAAVGENLPAKNASNLLVSTWNLRAFAGLTAKWNSAKGNFPKRDWRSVALIAEVIRRLDVVAVQEVRREITGLQFLLERLGDDCRVITSDVTEGDAGNGERLTFIYDSTRVQPSVLESRACGPWSCSMAYLRTSNSLASFRHFRSQAPALGMATMSGFRTGPLGSDQQIPFGLVNLWRELVTRVAFHLTFSRLNCLMARSRISSVTDRLRRCKLSKQ